MRSRVLLLACASVALVASNHHEDRVKIREAAGTAGTTVIEVSGPLGGPYKTVDSKWVNVTVEARLTNLPNNPLRNEGARILGETTEIARATLGRNWQRFRGRFPYQTPRSLVHRNVTVDPVEVCNRALQGSAGTARQEFLRNGKRIEGNQGYLVHVYQHWVVNKSKTGIFEEFEDKHFHDAGPVTAHILCKPLGGGQKVAKLPPLVKAISLRAEPMGEERIGGQICPDKLRLYGSFETQRAASVRALMRGPKFLTPPRDFTLPQPGSRSVTETYDIRWDPKLGTLAAQAAKRDPMRQSLEFQFNVADNNGHLLRHAKQRVNVACKVAPVPARVQLPPRRE